MDKYPEFLGNEQKNIDYWKRIQRKIIEKYGTDDHDATKLILEELNLDNKLIDIILRKSFGNSVEIAKSENWPLKLLYYADLRTLPNGIGTLEERIGDVGARMPKYTSRPDFDDLCEASIPIIR